MTKFLMEHEVDALRTYCVEFHIAIPEAATEADLKRDDAVRYLQQLEATPEPTSDADAIVDFRIRQPERIRIARDLVGEANYDRRIAWSQASAELFEPFAAVFAENAQVFIDAADELEPYRNAPSLNEPFGQFNVDLITDAAKGEVFTRARKAAENLDAIANVRRLLCLGDEPDAAGLLAFQNIAVDGRFRVSARYSLPTGGDNYSAVDNWNAVRLMPGVSQLRLQSPDDIRDEMAKAEVELRNIHAARVAADRRSRMRIH
jgi:hypothetical protein